MKIGRKNIGINEPTYFIADIASNHDGSLERAKRLIYLAYEAGADAVKFQNFKADTIVSDYGFKQLGPQSHQKDWPESVYDTYKKCETPIEWTPELKQVADDCGIDYLTTPYDLSIVPYLGDYVCAWKLGSGDITWKTMVETLAAYDKPLLISTGASTDDEIADALNWANFKQDVVLMQCNTNYTNDPNNGKFINLKVLVSWWGGGIMGFSDHSYNHSAVIGAIALGARVIEKHFTDDNSRAGPDHAFSLNPITWSTMIARSRELEDALGDGKKKVEENEKETRILQRRAVRTTRDIGKGEVLQPGDLIPLRPCPKDAIPPSQMDEVFGLVVSRDIPMGDYIRFEDV